MIWLASANNISLWHSTVKLCLYYYFLNAKRVLFLALKPFRKHLKPWNICQSIMQKWCDILLLFFIADSISVATEYSLKFDESMTEDEIEERSFRSLLPSESHRRGTLEKKHSRHEESEEESTHYPATSRNAAKVKTALFILVYCNLLKSWFFFIPSHFVRATFHCCQH